MVRPVNSFWGKLICDLCREQKVSNRQIALATGVNRGTLRNIREGKTTGSIDDIERLLAYLGHDLEAIQISKSPLTPARS